MYLRQRQIAIAQELKEPKEMIANTFTSQQISIVKTGSITAAALILVGVAARAFTIMKSRCHASEDDAPAAQASDPLLSD